MQRATSKRATCSCRGSYIDLVAQLPSSFSMQPNKNARVGTPVPDVAGLHQELVAAAKLLGRLQPADGGPRFRKLPWEWQVEKQLRILWARFVVERSTDAGISALEASQPRTMQLGVCNRKCFTDWASP